MRSLPLDLVLHAEDGLSLSRPTPADLDAITQACQDPDIVRFTRVPWPYTREDAEFFVTMAEDDLRTGTSVNLVVRDAGGTVLGSCGLPRMDERDNRAEVGYWVAPHARGRGVATRAARAVCRWAFDEVGLDRLGLEAATINPGSNGVARTLGFTLEGTCRSAHLEGGTDRPRRFDMNVWGLLPGELT